MNVAVLGAGQLGRMLGEAGLPLGVRCRFLDPADRPCAAAVGDVVQASFTDRAALDALAAWADVVTYEFENVPVEAVRYVSERAAVHPSPRALDVAQDRLAEKRFFRSLGHEVAPFAAVDTPADVARAVIDVGLPGILKTRRMGYDGKGQFVVNDPEQAERAFAALGEQPCVFERVIPFDRELSVIAARGLDGQVAVWPLFENRHAGGILRWSVAPAAAATELQARAERMVRSAAEALGYVGVLTLELFAIGDRLLINEMAPRVHNSGHGTIEASTTSQFENHLRAILGWPLGATEPLAPSVMLNLIGRDPDWPALLAVPGVRGHRYGKDERPGRKLGHVTVVGGDAETVAQRMDAARRCLRDG